IICSASISRTPIVSKFFIVHKILIVKHLINFVPALGLACPVAFRFAKSGWPPGLNPLPASL
ncbi:MAG TPA: hypothetical protein PKH79_12235, partial [Prolixibacteraceae bacterium]|nr:hypothetical protein [Prolixibacteraceae bacterium]